MPDIGVPPITPRFACLGLCPRHVCRCRSAAVVTYLLTYYSMVLRVRAIASSRRSLPRLCSEHRGMHSLSAHRCAASPAPALPPRVSFSPELTSEAPICRREGISGVGRPRCLAPSIIQSSSYSSSFERAGSPGAAGAAGGGGGAGAGGAALGAGDGALGAGGAALGAGGTASGALASREGGAASAAGVGGCAVAVGAAVAISLAAAAGGDA